MQWRKFQFGLQVVALAMFAPPALSAAQTPHPDRPPQRPPQAHPNQQQHPANANPPKANQNHPPANDYATQHPNRNPPQPHPNPNFNNNGAHNGTGAAYSQTPRQQLG